MLPFRLRPPVYGGGRGQRQQPPPRESAEQRYADGGPIQRAIYNDLSTIKHDFLAKLHDEASDSTLEHAKPGHSFAIFQGVFRDAKAALVHTRFAPLRCDHDAYSQLVYAVCFSFLQEAAAVGPTTLLDLQGTAFAIFAVYALYETNPLPIAPPVQSSTTRNQVLSMLPMNLSNRENPQMIYRRYFRAPIRIDAHHYSCLCRLREECLAKRTECHTNYVTKRLDAGTSNFVCQCSIATDILYVLNRLEDKLDLCAYTGPCSLEGLAGHADYPYLVNGTTREDTTTSLSFDPTVPVAASGASVLDNEISNTANLDEAFKDYHDKRSAIRLPPESKRPNPRSKRIRDALLPMFQDKRPTLSDLVSGEKTSKTVKLRRVTFGTIVLDDGSRVDIPIERRDDDTSQDLAQPENVNGGDESDNKAETALQELIFPNGLSARQEASIQAAVETLLERGDLLLVPPSSSVARAKHDDLSTLGPGGVSTASTQTGVGRSALQTLLVQAGAKATTGGFLDTEVVDKVPATKRKKRKVDTDDLSDMSSDDDDAISAATSAVGRRALGDLLRQGTSNSKTTTKTKRAPRLSKQPATRRRSPRRPGEQSRATEEEQEDQMGEESEDESSSSDESDEQASFGDTSSTSKYSSQGRAALEALLGQADL